MKYEGRVTLPTQKNFLKETKELIKRWGADAVRDSDGTELDKSILELDSKIYRKYFVARGHNDFIKDHPEEMQQLYLMSKYQTATSTSLTIKIMEGYYEEQLKPDFIHDPKKWWEVIDRTTGDVVDVEKWSINEEDKTVTIEDTVPFHEYTVSFLAYMTWDPTHMYNHITNDWGDEPYDIPFDVRQPNSQEYMKDYLRKWLKENPETDVVRFTTFFYHFTLVFNDLGKEKFVDWFGYGTSVSVAALEAFEKEKGYALRPEDLVDQGYYNTAFRVPTKAYLDYIDFIQQFVTQQAKELVDIVHEAGKEAMMFLGDNWIGTEPYGKYFENIGMDAVVGSVGDGVTSRMISDIPHIKYSEGRFLPYFFPDTFHEDNNPVVEANERWLGARRANMRKPLDRIGYGGYLDLAYDFPEFVDYTEKVTNEFREIISHIDESKPWSKLKVAIINPWGKLRSWQNFMVAHALWYKQIYSYQGILESLSGMPVEVEFLSFDDLKEDGIADDISVLINAGDAGTAFSGGDHWKDPELVSVIREWVYNGGGFIGIGEPSAVQHQGKYFQLSDVLGVDKELGFSLSTNKYFEEVTEDHFINQNRTEYDFGESVHNIYSTNENTTILEYSNNEIHLATSTYGQGRSVYIAGLPYSIENTRLLLKSLIYAAGKEDEYNIWHSTNPNCEINVYPETNYYGIINNSMEAQETEIFDGDGNSKIYHLEPSELLWERIK